MSGLETGRINVGARAVGVAQAALDASMRYIQQRETFGVPISQHQAIQLKIADMATKIQAARLLVYDAAAKKDSGERIDLESGMAKLFASEVCGEVSMEAMRIHGGYGYTKDFRGAVLPGRPPHDHRRRHQRDHAAGDSAATAAASRVPVVA